MKETYATSTLTAGAHKVAAAYNGSTNFANSTSASVTQGVQKGPEKTKGFWVPNRVILAMVRAS
jgi:hypothetical protein